VSDVILEVKNLVKNYSGAGESLHILKGLSFEARQGQSVSITGKSGSGKSSLLNILGGLDGFDEGSVVVGGLELAGLSEAALTEYRKRRVGFIFQFHYLLGDFTALENVMLPAYIAWGNKKAAMEKAAALLADVRLGERAGHYPSQLSGGERQRVAVARSLINDPDIILADEPTGNLDPENSELVAGILYETSEKHGKTLIVVTHDTGVAARAEVKLNLEHGILEAACEV
jgi:lipoprotein-releasing system ATP-binding protein